jgi:alpha-D-ribose 1-methylphosphonate 5-triphosphate diphosphatase PhnM
MQSRGQFSLPTVSRRLASTSESRSPQAVRHSRGRHHLEMPDAMNIASREPARMTGLDDRGEIGVGADDRFRPRARTLADHHGRLAIRQTSPVDG